MIVLDTNVVSELMRDKPDRKVESWVGSQPASGLFITTITEAELRYGVAILPQGRRRDSVSAAMEAMLSEEFAERVLPFDGSAAVAYAAIAAGRRRAGRPIGQFDAQIAAIAHSRGAALATRNAADFDGCGIDVLNPWTSRAG
jgi:predicted nucleic acid-binding protein